MRTLILSDLHLGNRLDHDVLARPAALARLEAALADVDRLVLLGDTLELMHGRPESSMRRAEPILRRIAAALNPGAAIILVPGNHDFPLVRRWVWSDPTRLTADTLVPGDVSPRLQRLVAWLGGADRVRVHYPGVWLSDEVYAIHGHYLDHHLFPRGGFGVSRGLFGGLPDGRVTPAVYERRRPKRRDDDSRTRARDRVVALQLGLFGTIRRRLLSPRLAPMTSALLDRQMRHVTIPVLAHIARRLGAEPDWLIYGHVHRAGPLPDDEPGDWTPGPQVLNTGSWLHEPILVGGTHPPHGYWPGSAVVHDTGAPPRVVGLLDELRADEL